MAFQHFHRRCGKPKVPHLQIQRKEQSYKVTKFQNLTFKIGFAAYLQVWLYTQAFKVVHTWITGYLSSSEANTICVATSGCHSTALHRICHDKTYMHMYSFTFRELQFTVKYMAHIIILMNAKHKYVYIGPSYSP